MNIKLYGKKSPDMYELSNIDMKVGLFIGTLDR